MRPGRLGKGGAIAAALRFRAPLAGAMAMALVLGTGQRTALAAEEPPVADRIVAAFDKVFKGPHAGERAIHAKGVVSLGTFAPDPGAASLTAAAHFSHSDTVPVIVRFSAFSGVPTQIDGKPGTNPTGMAVKFLLPDGTDADIVAHSYDGFPAATPEEFLAYLGMIAAGDPQRREAFLAEHEAARRFFADPKPTPVSYGTEAFFAVHAFRFTNAAAISRFGRYRIRPLAGERHLTAAEAANIAPEYLHDELVKRLDGGPVKYRVSVQLASVGDSVTDPGLPWPSDRAEVVLGTLTLTRVADPKDAALQTVFFTPMNLVAGISASGDPLLAARTRAYALSYQRRAASE